MKIFLHCATFGKRDLKNREEATKNSFSQVVVKRSFSCMMETWSRLPVDLLSADTFVVDVFGRCAFMGGVSAHLLRSCVVHVSQMSLVSLQHNYREAIRQHLIGSNFSTRTSDRVLHRCRKNVINSMCPVSRVEPLGLMMLMAVVESLKNICVLNGSESTVSGHPNSQGKSHSCICPIPSDAPENAATISASTQLSAIVDCFLLVVVVVRYQPCFPRIRDGVPFAVCWSESHLPGQCHWTSKRSLHSLFACSKPDCDASTVVAPGLYTTSCPSDSLRSGALATVSDSLPAPLGVWYSVVLAEFRAIYTFNSASRRVSTALISNVSIQTCARFLRSVICCICHSSTLVAFFLTRIFQLGMEWL